MNRLTDCILYERYEELERLLKEEKLDPNSRSHEDHGGYTVLIYSSYSGNIRTSSILLRYGAGINLLTNEGATALTAAIVSCKLELAHFLLQNGADPNIYEKNQWSPLSMAARDGSLKLVESLLYTGARVNDGLQYTSSYSLFWAVYNRHINVARLLLQKGANVDSANYWRETPLMITTMKPFRRMLYLLLEYKADVFITDVNGKRAIEKTTDWYMRDFLQQVESYQESLFGRLFIQLRYDF